jgi:tetratricopeptide (TPR) repeat protein
MSDAHYDISGSIRGNVVQARDIYLAGNQQPAHSAYLHLVRDKIAPRQLLDRDAELDDLARFCIQREGPSYAWWRADAWSGKSALLAWFVLNPPSNVRIVSFFVTARIPGQSDRDAFTKTVAEQLAELLDRAMPSEVVHWDATLLQLIDAAASTCTGRGERLILLVDGLDEDRGVTTSPDSYSIAGLLPSHPPHGMRVIVAGRPNPPVPSDVRGDHPLHDPTIVRRLTASPHAEAVKQDATRELKRLLTGTPAERDLLGLLAASGGGLTSTDLAELTDSMPWFIQDHLRAVTARSFAPRSASGDVEAYVFGHEQLLKSASAFLGLTGLAAYRARLHGWADDYRARGWPADTPMYLLRGYQEMLKKVGDRDRLITCALDIARHERLRGATAGDSAALDELDAAQEILLAQDSPDLSLMTRIAVHRSVLVDNNDVIPTDVAVVWAELGEIERAESLAAIRRGAGIQAETLAEVAVAAALSGKLDTAQRIMQRALALAEGVRNELSQELLGPTIAHALAMIGDIDGAAAKIRTIRSATNLAKLIDTIRHVLNFDGADNACRLANAINDRARRVQALLAIAEASIAAGDQNRAKAIVEQVAADVDSIDVDWITIPPADDADMLAALRLALFRGNRERAQRIFQNLEFQASAPSQASSLTTANAAIEAAVLCGHLDRAEKIVSSFLGSEKSLIKLVCELGDFDRAERIARTISDGLLRSSALAAVAFAVGRVGAVDRAEDIARSIPDEMDRAQVLIAVARAALAAGAADRARQLLLEAQATPDRFHIDVRLRTLTTLVTALADRGHVDQARRLVTRSVWLAKATLMSTDKAAFARAAMNVGDVDTAETVTRFIDQGFHRDRGLATLAGDIAATGDVDRAINIRCSIDDPVCAMQASVLIVGSLATVGDLDRAEVVARAVDPDRPQYSRDALHVVITAAIRMGDTERVLRLALCLPEYGRTDELMSTIATARRAGRPDIATRIVDLAEAEAQRQPDRYSARCRAVRVAIANDQLDRAEQLARVTPYEWEHAEGLAIVAIAAAHEDRMVLARSLFDEVQAIEHILDKELRDPVTVAAMRVAVAIGELEWAETQVGRIIHGPQRREGLVALASAAADAHDFHRGAEFADALDDFRRENTLADIVDKMIEAREFDLAESWAKTKLNTPDGLSSLARLCTALVLADQLDDAERVAASLPGSERKTVTATIITAAAVAGDIERAVRLAYTDDNEVTRLKPLIAAVQPDREITPDLVARIERMARECTSQNNLARALALLVSVVPPATVPRLVAEVLAIGGWRQLIDVLEPAGLGDLLPEIAEVYLELT